jgi:hypothetical protein
VATTSTTNIDIDYVHKDFSSTVDALISFANVNYGPGTTANRLWTNFNVDSFSRNWLEIVAYVTDSLFFYFDAQATQSYLQTATIRSAVLDIAKQFGFTPAGATSATGNATFTFTAAGTLSRGFRVKSSTGLEYYLTNDIVAGSAGNYTGTVIQGAIKLEQFTAVGLQSEEFNLVGPNVIRDLTNLNSNDISPIVTVNGNQYTLVDTFIKSNGTDTVPVIDSLGKVIGGGGRVFTLELRPDGTPFVRFGDGLFGRKILPGELVSVTYRTGGGSAGNISEQSLTTLVDDNAVVTGVTNAAKFSGGSDEQSLDQLRELIPASLRTLDRAVAEQDYSDLLKVTFSEVQAASTEKNTSDPGIDLNVYVVPTGVGISKISDNTALKTKLSNFLDRRKMVTVQFQILDAFGVDVLISLEVFITDTASKTSVKQAINTALLDLFNLTSGGASGAGIGFAEEILLKDISNIIQGISGVSRFEIKRLTYRPRVQKNVIGLNTSYASSTVDIFKNVSESEWLLGAAGPVTRIAGTTVYNNTALTGYTYNSTSGLVTYSFPVDLGEVAVGDSLVTPRGEVTKFTTVADAGGTLNSTYFTMADNIGPVRVWFNTGGGTPPATPPGGRLIEVTVALNSTAAAVATALKNTLDLDTKFSASVSTNEVTVVDEFEGTRTDALDFDTGFAISILRQGSTSALEFVISSVDVKNSKLYISPGQLVSTGISAATMGSIKSGATVYDSFKCFKKLNVTATNLSIDSITDNSLDLSIKLGTGNALSARVLLDNTQVFVPGEYATGVYYLVDASGNIWEITANDSNTLTTSITAVNDASITSVASGDYKIVEKLVGSQVILNQNIFNVQYNSEKTIFSVGAQFSNIGTIGDDFQISRLQTNKGNLGVALDLISYDSSTKTLRLNNAPDLQGLSSKYFLIDNSGQVFNVVAIDNRSLPSTFYEDTNQDTTFILKGTGLGSQYAQGFQVGATNVYSVVSFNLKKEGNILGSLVAKIVNDDGSGLPNLASPVASTQAINVSTLSESFGKLILPFTVPPTLNAGTQYHLVLQPDAAYSAAQIDNFNTFSNTGLVAFSYNSLTGIVQYASTVNLGSVSPGHYFRDGAGTLFKIQSVDDSSDRITLALGLTVDLTLSTANDGAVFKKDNVYVGCDQSSPTYTLGKGSQFDGSVWADDAQGPVLNRFSANTDFVFSVEGPKTITVESNLTPSLGVGATLSERYYDDEQEVSLILGISAGLTTFATDTNAIGKGTVNTIPNSKVDNFVFRTSRFADDIVNLRLMEIPQLQESDIILSVFGGIE